ncbi:hypothetical protein SAMN05192582_105917 [Bacteroides ovatus]|uniref:Uncharacterized protein n=1 Tax=Bacteroides ovatus TaxID=28116 RepID=A0A1G8M115_BACOV|nr:hypothetical protein SAMN05192582_105917 [Bacteroides ovatus]
MQQTGKMDYIVSFKKKTTNAHILTKSVQYTKETRTLKEC